MTAFSPLGSSDGVLAVGGLRTVATSLSSLHLRNQRRDAVVTAHHRSPPIVSSAISIRENRHSLDCSIHILLDNNILSMF